MPGFSAIGHFAIGQVADATVSTVTLVAAPASYAVTGVAATFSVAWPQTTASYSLTGNVATFSVQFEPANTSYAVTGGFEQFLLIMAAANTSYVVTGNGIGSPSSLHAEVGMFAITGNVAFFGASVVSSATGSFAVTGVDATFMRTFEEWITQSDTAESWSNGTIDAESWTPATQQVESWTAAPTHPQNA